MQKYFIVLGIQLRAAMETVLLWEINKDLGQPYWYRGNESGSIWPYEGWLCQMVQRTRHNVPCRDTLYTFNLIQKSRDKHAPCRCEGARGWWRRCHVIIRTREGTEDGGGDRKSARSGRVHTWRGKPTQERKRCLDSAQRQSLRRDEICRSSPRGKDCFARSLRPRRDHGHDPTNSTQTQQFCVRVDE